MHGVRSPVIVEIHPLANLPAGFRLSRESMQIDALVLQRPPEVFDEDVVEEAPAAFHRDAHAGILQALRPGLGGELAALIGG